MMFLEHWSSPRSSLFSLFSNKNITNIRIKLCNKMLFNPTNTGNKNPVITLFKKKNPVITYDHNQVLSVLGSFFDLFFQLTVFFLGRWLSAAVFSCFLFYFSFHCLQYFCWFVKVLMLCQKLLVSLSCNRVVLKEVPYNMFVLCCTSYKQTLYYSS